MSNFKNIMEKIFEEPFLQAELHRAKITWNTNNRKNYQGELATALMKNYRAFQTWATK